MDKKIAHALALFRFRIIAPVLAQDLVQQKEYFQTQASKTWEIPHYGEKRFTPSAFKHWLSYYRRGGFDALIPSLRSDAGKARKIDSELAALITAQAEQYSDCSVSAFYRHLSSKGLINPPPVSQSALRRFVESNRLLSDRADPVARKKFEKEHVNQLWTSDFMYGPYLKDGKRKRQTYLCAVIDDHSRMIVGWLWSFNETSATLEMVLKEAIARFGLPSILYTDNGSAFSNQSLELACARLGIALVHSKPYDSPSRGKIERYFRTVRDKFLRTPEGKEPQRLDQLNEGFSAWLDSDYHKVVHSGISTTPLDRWNADLQETQLRYLTREELYFAFCQTFKRKVKNDSTIQLENRIWQVPPRYIGSTIEVRYPTGCPNELYLFENEKNVCRLSLCNPNENATSPANSIRFADQEEK
jgi:transposase InsO family protein